MLDGEETVELCGELCWERDSMLDGDEAVEIACGELRWEGARQHAGRRGSRANSLRRAAHAGSETAFKPWKWLGERSMQSCRCGFVRAVGTVFFRTNVIIAIVLKNCGHKTGQTVPRPVKRKGFL